MTRSISFLLLLAGCGVDDATTTEGAAAAIGSASTPASTGRSTARGLTADGLTADELSHEDVRGAATSMALIAKAIQQLPPAAKAEATESLRFLTVNCPYTRSAMQLAFALHAVVMAIEPERFDPLVRGDWQYLQQGLTTHVELLEALGVELAPPAQGDYLEGRAPRLMVSRDDVRAAEDPIAVTAALVHAIPELIKQIDAPTNALIGRHSDRVESSTGVARPCSRGPWAALPGQPWTLGMQLGDWHDALRRVEPFTKDAKVAAQLAAMRAVLGTYAEASLE